MADKIYIQAKLPGDSGWTTLPSPTDIKISDELIWSSDTGRGQTENNITMQGSLLGEKKTISVTWGLLSKSEFNTIRTKTSPSGGWFSIKVYLDGSEFSGTVYRGNIEKEVAGVANNVVYYRNVSIEFVEK